MERTIGETPRHENTAQFILKFKLLRNESY